MNFHRLESPHWRPVRNKSRNYGVFGHLASECPQIHVMIVAGRERGVRCYTNRKACPHESQDRATTTRWYSQACRRHNHYMDELLSIRCTISWSHRILISRLSTVVAAKQSSKTESITQSSVGGGGKDPRKSGGHEPRKSHPHLYGQQRRRLVEPNVRKRKPVRCKT